MLLFLSRNVSKFFVSLSNCFSSTQNFIQTNSCPHPHIINIIIWLNHYYLDQDKSWRNPWSVWTNHQNGVNEIKILHSRKGSLRMRRCVKNSIFMEELMWDLQNKLVQNEVFFGRLVSNQTSDINDVKRLCILQKI